jgi:hypothetical protein
MSKYVYNDYVKTIADRFEAALSKIQAIHNFDHGPEFEIAICEVLRLALPEQYGICRGHVISSSGDQAGDDVIIYDTMRFPTLRLNTRDDYARKEWIPIEAVYAYIEAKHTINIEGNDGACLTKACAQVSKVKTLCDGREAVLPSQINQHIGISGSNALKITTPRDYPTIKNPMYGMVFARNVRDKKDGIILNDPLDIRERILRLRTPLEVKSSPDALILGTELIVIPVIPAAESLKLASAFYINNLSKLHAVPLPGIAFGLGLCLLHFALDWIQLGTMPWSKIILDCFNNQNR